jgi:AraC-like DNA-binding protein
LIIHKAAALIHLSPGAFCKFFKRITGKTFSDYVNEVRIANVCNQLMATDKQVAEIAYGNGFETLTYFNRVFLKKKGMRPGEYRKQFA